MWGICSLLKSQFTYGQAQCVRVLIVYNVLYITSSHFMFRVILCHHILTIHYVSTRFITIDHPYSCRRIVHCAKVFCWHLQPTLNKFYLILSSTSERRSLLPFKVSQYQIWWCHCTSHIWFPIRVYDQTRILNGIIRSRKLSDLEFDFSRSLKVKSDGAVGLPMSDFIVVFNGNIWANCTSVWNVCLQNLSNLYFDLSRSLKVKSWLMVQLDSPYIISCYL